MIIDKIIESYSNKNYLHVMKYPVHNVQCYTYPRCKFIMKVHPSSVSDTYIPARHIIEVLRR